MLRIGWGVSLVNALLRACVTACMCACPCACMSDEFGVLNV